MRGIYHIRDGVGSQGSSLERGANNIARPTRGAALATRAKVLLYAASPLMNGNTDSYAQQW